MKKTPDLVYKIPGEQPVVVDTPEIVRQDLAQIFQNAAPAESVQVDNAFVLGEARANVQQALTAEQSKMIAEVTQMGHGLKNKRLAVTR